jgi:hypothetical protein
MDMNDLPELPPCAPPAWLDECVRVHACEDIEAFSRASGRVRLPLVERLGYAVMLATYALYAADFTLRLLLAAR